VFYDALLVSVADDAHSDRVSALGYGLGYLGGGVLFAVNVLMYLKPALFGLADGPAGIRASFATVAVWWALFTIPLLKRVQERAAATSLADGATQRSALARALGETRKTLGRLRDMPALRNFLIAYWLYIDGIDTIQRMAVDYGLSIGLPSQSLIIALLIVQFVGFPAAIVFGKLAGRIGAKRAILIGVAAYVVITVLGYGMQTTRDFYALAVMVGLVQGGVQALSRSLYSRLIPADEAGEFFGFYNMLGRFSAVIGPVLMGGVGLLTGSPRLSILSIALLLLAGGALLLRVNEPSAPARS
jgi:UMF1 family MFS transporter